MFRPTIAFLSLLLIASILAFATGCVSVQVNLPGDDESHHQITITDEEPVQEPMPEPAVEVSQEPVQAPENDSGEGPAAES
jgi:hypothetical protein